MIVDRTVLLVQREARREALVRAGIEYRAVGVESQAVGDLILDIVTAMSVFAADTGVCPVCDHVEAVAS